MLARTLIQRFGLTALSPWLPPETDHVWNALAGLAAGAAVLGNGRMRAILRAAMEALGSEPTPQTVGRFTWEWWRQRAVDDLLTYRADCLTTDWAERHVLVPAGPVPQNCIFVSVHQFNLHVAAVRAAALVNELGLVSMVERVERRQQAPPDGGTAPGFLLNPAERSWAISRFQARVFGKRTYPPSVAARQGLELLQRGGSLIVLPDFFGDSSGTMLGKSIPVSDGPIWWAQHTGCPIVPFVLYPPCQHEPRWRLWWDEPIPATRTALTAALVNCVRRAPTTWVSWRGWYTAPCAHSAQCGAELDHTVADRFASSNHRPEADSWI
jgi:hypothetical protein